jgi:hypothetical protein
MKPNGGDVHRDIGAVHIDGAEFYRMMLANQNTLVRVEAQLAALVDSVRDDARDTKESLEKHDKRLGAVERRVWQLPSIPTLIALGALILNILQASTGG